MKDIERQKLIEAIVFFAQNTKWCGSIKLFKLLFFLDMLNFRETGRSVTGLQYTALPMGPVPVSLLEEFKMPKPDLAEKVLVVHPAQSDTEAESKRTKITPRLAWVDHYLTVREKRIALELADIFFEASAEDMSQVSHARGGPWEKARDRSPGKWKGTIDYLDSLSPTLKMGSGRAKNREELKQRAAEFEDAKQFFE
jgi:uncharacterized phage-associated protein